MKISPDSPFYAQLYKMTLTPKTQLKKLAVGTLLSILAMLGLIFTSQLENQILFYTLNVLLAFAMLYAIPGYIGIWVWRMRAVLFEASDLEKEKNDQRHS